MCAWVSVSVLVCGTHAHTHTHTHTHTKHTYRRRNDEQNGFEDSGWFLGSDGEWVEQDGAEEEKVERPLREPIVETLNRTGVCFTPPTTIKIKMNLSKQIFTPATIIKANICVCSWCMYL